jgi:hypothetical protein
VDYIREVDDGELKPSPLFENKFYYVQQCCSLIATDNDVCLPQTILDKVYGEREYIWHHRLVIVEAEPKFPIRPVYSRQSTDKQVDVTGVSTVSYTGSLPHFTIVTTI